MPRSRLAREPVEAADAGLERIQQSLRIETMAALFEACLASDDTPDAETMHGLARHAGIHTDVLQAAKELADVDRRIGGGET